MVTQERLKELLHYDPVHGVFTWRKTQGSRGLKGTEAGSLYTSNPFHRKPYRFIRLDGKGYLAHRLAWLYVTGVWPDGVIDHINRNNQDNSWVNLRDT